MVYHPPPASEPNGCIQTLVISRIIFMILLIPIVLISLVLFGVMIVFYAYSEHPLLGLLGLTVVCSVVFGVMRWERYRIDKEQPPEL